MELFEFVCSKQQKMKLFLSFKDKNGELWEEVIIVYFFGCSSDRGQEEKLVETGTVHFARLKMSS